MITDHDGEVRIHVIQGEFVVTADPNAMLTTILGSCVSACMWEPVAKVGGMNHFLLPDNRGNGSSSSVRYGVHLMELLVNGLMQKGARRDRIQVKLFGGARLLAGLSDIGALNAQFAESFVKTEGFGYQGGSLRGASGRRIQFWPNTGRARQTYIDDSQLAQDPVRRKCPVGSSVGEVELFQ